jgi:hypothetical protein
MTILIIDISISRNNGLEVFADGMHNLANSPSLLFFIFLFYFLLSKLLIFNYPSGFQTSNIQDRHSNDRYSSQFRVEEVRIANLAIKYLRI